MEEPIDKAMQRKWELEKLWFWTQALELALSYTCVKSKMCLYTQDTELSPKQPTHTAYLEYHELN